MVRTINDADETQEAAMRMAVALPGGVHFSGEGGDRRTQAGSPFIVDVWTSKEGLPENAVISVIQTRDGYLWLGTLNGLVRFDGTHFTVFNEYDTPGFEQRPDCLFV